MEWYSAVTERGDIVSGAGSCSEVQSAEIDSADSAGGRYAAGVPIFVF